MSQNKFVYKCVLENNKHRYVGSKWKQEAVKCKLIITNRLNGTFELRYLSNIFLRTQLSFL